MLLVPARVPTQGCGKWHEEYHWLKAGWSAQAMVAGSNSASQRVLKAYSAQLCGVLLQPEPESGEGPSAVEDILPGFCTKEGAP